jgi:catechol 2,3-dioxygenase-like lactoylglutathione lyase family enzyme
MRLFDGSILLISISILVALSPCECFLVARKSKGNVNVDNIPRRQPYSSTFQGLARNPPLDDGGPIYASSSDIPLSQKPQIPPPVYLQIHHTALKTRNITNAIEFYSLLGYQVASKFRAGPARAAWLELPQGSTAAVSAVSRLELLEVPAYMLLQLSLSPTAGSGPNPRVRAPNLMDQPAVLGYNHVALDVTYQIQQMQIMQEQHDHEELDSATSRNTMASTSTSSASTTSTSTSTSNSAISTTVNVSLADWMSRLNATSVELFAKTLRVALEPQQQIIGRNVYELAFLFDADGCLVELLNLKRVLPLTVNVQSGWEPWDGVGFVGSQ